MKSIFELFKEYYQMKFTEDIPIPDTKFRHFRLQLFSDRIRFRRIRDIITTKKQLYQVIVKTVPKNAYFMPVKWLNPIFSGKTKGELDVMLSSPLYFDIDLKDLNPPTFKKVTENTKKLIEYIIREYGQSPDLVVFSGRQGYHVHYWNWDFSDLISINPQERILRFKREREKITLDILKNGIVIDKQITIDPYRILKIPNTLHGITGLIAKPVEDLDNFKPLIDAVAFDHQIYSEVFHLRESDFR